MRRFLRSTSHKEACVLLRYVRWLFWAAPRKIAPKGLTAESTNPMHRFVGAALHVDGEHNTADDDHCHRDPLADVPSALAAGVNPSPVLHSYWWTSR